MATYRRIVVMRLVVLAKILFAIEETRPAMDLPTNVGTIATAATNAATFDNYTSVPLNTSFVLQPQELLNQKRLLIQYCVAVTERQYDITGLKQKTCFKDTKKEYMRRCKTRTSDIPSSCSILKRNLRKVIKLHRNLKTRGNTKNRTAVCVRKANHQIYNMDTHICCGHHIAAIRMISDKCCRNIIYDQNKQICCNSVVSPLLSNDTTCCGKQAYDRQKHFCSNKMVYVRPMYKGLTKRVYTRNVTNRFKRSTYSLTQSFVTQRTTPQLLDVFLYQKSKEGNKALLIIVICVILVLVPTTVTVTLCLRSVKEKVIPKPFANKRNNNTGSITDNASNCQSDQDGNVNVSGSYTISNTSAAKAQCVVLTPCEVHEQPTPEAYAQLSNGFYSNNRTNDMSKETIIASHYDNDANIHKKGADVTNEVNRKLKSLRVDNYGSTRNRKGPSSCVIEQNVSSTSPNDPKETYLLNNGLEKTESICSYSQSLRSYYSEISMTLDQYENTIKPSNIKNINCINSIFKDDATQTLPFKKINKLNSFGVPFKFNEVMTKHHRTIILTNSDVRMTLPIYDMNKHDIECFADSFSDVASCRRKLGFTELEHLTAPVIEYDMMGEEKLDDFAIIEMPVVNFEDLHVLRYESDSGEIDVAKRIEVPVLDAVDECLDTFAIISRKKVCVYIYTKIFSIYTCICNGEKRELRMKTWLFGKITKHDVNNYSAEMVLYILDNLYEFRDYNKVIVKQEMENGRKELKPRERIQLFDKVSCKDSIQSYLNAKKPWKHMMDEDEPDIDYNHKTVTLQEVCNSFQESSPYSRSWTMEAKRETGELSSSFEGFVHIKSWKYGEEHDVKRTPLTAFSLSLQQQPNADKSSDINTICEVFVSTTHIDESNFKKQLIGDLTIKPGGLRGVLMDLSKLFYGDAFVERVANALKRIDLRREIVELNTVGIIPDNMLPDYVRRELKQLPVCSMDNRVPRKPIEDDEGNTFYPLGCFTDKSSTDDPVTGVRTEILRGEFDSDEYSNPLVRNNYQCSQHVSADNIAKHLVRETKHYPESIATRPTLSSVEFAIFPPAVSDDGPSGEKLLSKSEPAMYKSEFGNPSQTEGKAIVDSYRYDPSLPTNV